MIINVLVKFKYYYCRNYSFRNINYYIHLEIAADKQVAFCNGKG